MRFNFSFTIVHWSHKSRRLFFQKNKLALINYTGSQRIFRVIIECVNYLFTLVYCLFAGEGIQKTTPSEEVYF